MKTIEKILAEVVLQNCKFANLRFFGFIKKLINENIDNGQKMCAKP